MRIAILAPLVTAIREPQLGGSQALVADLATGLALRGHEVEVFASSGSSIPRVNVIDTGVEPASLTPALFRHDRPVAAEGAVTTRPAFERAYGMIATGDYDIVHNHAFDVPAFEARLGVPLVHTLHLPPDRAVAKALRKARPAAVVCVSHAHARAWSAIAGVDIVVSNGVPVRTIAWAGAGGERALFAGRLSPEKGAAEAIAIARLAGVDIEVYGDPYDPDYAASLDGDVRPAIPRTELWERMASACAVLCPIRWEEPFGLVAAEAQAAGAPVIGFARGGLPEVVGVGALVSDGDLHAAAVALAHADGFDRAACRRHAEDALDLEQTLDEYEALYARLTS